jgi:hypothetical protein
MQFHRARFLFPVPLVIVLGGHGYAGEIRSPRDVNGAKVRPITQAEQGSEADRMACTPDVFRLCGRHTPNVDDIVSCLENQKPNLSPACRVVPNAPSR